MSFYIDSEGFNILRPFMDILYETIIIKTWIK